MLINDVFVVLLLLKKSGSLLPPAVLSSTLPQIITDGSPSSTLQPLQVFAPGHCDESMTEKESDVHLPPLPPQTECEAEPTYAEPVVPSSLTVRLPASADGVAYEEPKDPEVLYFLSAHVYTKVLGEVHIPLLVL